MGKGRHVRDDTPREGMEKAVRNAVLSTFVAQAVALVSGRVPWPTVLVMVISVSYLVEAIGQWRAAREDAELNAILDAEDALAADDRELLAA